MRIDGYICDHPGCPRWVSYGGSGIGSGWSIGHIGLFDYCPDHQPAPESHVSGSSS